jgi:four helix bundle protein
VPFVDLSSYRLAAELADYVYELVSRWPQPARFAMGTQVIRSADSIGANIAESTGRETTPDKRRFLIIARGSLRETEHWLLRAHARGLVAEMPSEHLEKLGRVLHGQIRRPGP